MLPPQAGVALETTDGQGGLAPLFLGLAVARVAECGRPAAESWAIARCAEGERPWLAACVRAGGSREARAAGRGSSPGPEPLPLILPSFQGNGPAALAAPQTPSEPSRLGPEAAAGRGSPGPVVGVSAERAALLRAAEQGTERRRPRTRCKCGFRKVLLLSSREFIFPCLLDSSSWPSGDFFFPLPLFHRWKSSRASARFGTCPPVFLSCSRSYLGLSR